MDDTFAKYHAVLKVCVPFLLFLLFFTPDCLNPTHVGWLMHGDWGQHFLGWHAYRHTPLHWPFNHEDLLAHPTGLSLIYTDSNPLLALPLRLISPLLPNNFQYIGPWFLLCLILHFYIAYRLVKPHAPGPWSTLAGATLLSLLPTLYNRIGHDTLVAHWLILWALFIFFEVKTERKKALLYAALLGVAGLVHPYLLFMILFVWAGDQIRVLAPLLKARQWPALGRAVVLSVAPLLPMVAALAVSGAFSGSSASSEGFGIYSMGLDAPFNPVRKDFTFAFLRGPEDAGQSFEGFQYLGFGLLGLIGAALYIHFRLPDGKATDMLSRARPLKWPFIVLFVLALSDHIQLYGLKLPKIPLPLHVTDFLGIVRATGRLFWPIAYTFVFLALITVYRRGGKVMAICLSLAVVLQGLDMAPFATDVRALTASAKDAEVLHTTKSPQWQALIAHADLVSFQPPQPLAYKDLFYELTYHAISQGVPVSTMYAARDNVAQKTLEYKDYQAFVHGAVDPRHLYILLDRCAPPPGAESRLRELDGVWFIPPLSAADIVTTRPTPATYQLGTTYDFNQSSQAVCQLDHDWSLPEIQGVWSEGGHAGLTLPIHMAQPRDLSLHLSANSYGQGKTVHVLVNGTELSRIDLGKKRSDYVLAIPAKFVRPDGMTIGFIIDQPMSNAEMTRRRETRRLGIKLYSVSLN